MPESPSDDPSLLLVLREGTEVLRALPLFFLIFLFFL